MTTARAALPVAGSPVDVAPFAQVHWWTGSERQDLRTHTIAPNAQGLLTPAQDAASGPWQLGLEWDNPRDIARVAVRFAGPIPTDLQVQYWRNNWPTEAPERRPGASRGWIGRDDPFHGEWTAVRGAASVDGETYSLAFDPLDVPELAGHGSLEQLVQAQHYRASFRRTLKLRLVSPSAMPAVAELHAYTPSVWKEGAVEVRFGVGPQGNADWSGAAEVINGYLAGVEAGPDAPVCAVQADGSWRCVTEGGQSKGVVLRLLYAEGSSRDDTLVTVRTTTRTFTFRVADLAQGPIHIPDYGVVVAWAGQVPEPAALQARIAAAPKPIYDRVAAEPEQSLTRALAEIPALDVTKVEPFGRYLPLAAEAGRQEWAVRYNGELFASKRHLKLLGRDAARLQWPGELLRFRFGSGDPVDFRERRDGTQQSLLDGWLPVVESRWLDREIEYRQTAFACLLDGPLTGPDKRRGDEDMVAMLRFSIRNTTHGRKRARLWIVVAPQEELALQEGLVLAQGRVVPDVPVARQWRVDAYRAPVLRAAVTPGRGRLSLVPCAGQAGESQATLSAVAYDVDLEGGGSDTLVLAVPFVSFAEPADWRRVAALDETAKRTDVVNYWRALIEPAGRLELPDPILGDLHRAVRTHVTMGVDKDPVSGMIVVPAATWSYGACGNEACWQTTMLDQAGHHDRAELYLETFIRTQGWKGLDGDFQSPEGALNSMDLDAGVPATSHFSYNLDHGYIMECLVAHYRYTGDQAWLERVAPNLVAACDLIIRERQATKVNGPDGKPHHAWGLLPAGHLEDNPEWRHWFAVNAHAHGGMAGCAEILAEIGHPEAERLAQEAEAYRQDIRAAARRAMEEAPVVRLLDGTFVPHIPTRTGLRGREWGWFREAAYGAVHLLDGNVFEPHEPEITWLLKDLEDNLFVTREFGRPVDLEQRWFSLGGVTIQANLMDLSLDYLRRGQPEHAIRALFNNIGQQLFPDVRCFTEHPVIEPGHGVGPFYKTPDESKALIWLRHNLLWEERDVLHIAPAAPRAWFAAGQWWGVQRLASFFGPVSYKVETGETQVTVEIDVPDRCRPREIVVHIRRPGRAPIKAVTVNNKAHEDWDAAAEVVRLRQPAGVLRVRVQF